MKIDNSLKFTLTDWTNIPSERHEGLTGFAIWRVLMFGDVRVRMVEYGKNYLADHWCEKGHFIYCIEGEMTTELRNGKKFTLKKGMTYEVGDNSDNHRTFSLDGVKLFIVD